MHPIYIIGTCDTKFHELDFVKQRIIETGQKTVLVDVGTLAHSHSVDITAQDIANFHPSRKDFLQKNDGRGDAVIAMSDALVEFLLSIDDIGGVIGLGGSGGTALITKGMQALPVGLPKVMVSTVASGNVSPYVGATDICMMYSITDIAGINQVSNTILANAAHAIAGMVREKVPEYKVQKPALGMTMFGVTTPCVNQIREELENEYDCLIFHATGTGGRSMEKLIDSGFISYVIDMTLTEVCDLQMGGIMSAGEDRLGAIIRTKVPYIGSVGALDMVNFGHINTVPEKYKNRNLYRHNEQVTLMRTTPEENHHMGIWIANKLNQCEGSVRFFLPEKGVSLIATEGQPFHDPQADQALFDAISSTLNQTANRKLISLPYHINDPKFSKAVVDSFKEIINI